MNESATFFYYSLIKWFLKYERPFPWRNTRDPYKIFVAEKMLQQTSYGHVLKVYDKFLNKYSSINLLNKASIEEIKEVIKPLGFHNQKSKQFKDISLKLLDDYNGKIPNNKNKLIKLKGIGNYIANAILCFAFDMDYHIVDVNVVRVLSRYFGVKPDIRKIDELITNEIQIKDYRSFNLGLIDFSSILCNRVPKCKQCIMNEHCLFSLSCR